MDSFGPGVSRVLQSVGTQYLETIWQQDKPPTDADLNLMQQLAGEATQASLLRGMPSGFLGNETNPQRVYVTDPAWSNHFRFGPRRGNETFPIVWAHVNGWLIPVAGTLTGSPPGAPNDTDYSNLVSLDPPPSASTDSRVDFVFLEVFKVQIQPSPSTTNKPSANGIYKYGNVESGFSFIPDDLVDPGIGFETNQRVQLQYRIRVVKGLVGLSANPDGFDSVVVKAQGAAAAPVAAYTFTNMRRELGDPGLWRAGNGQPNALGTVDGYSYAIPIAVVFRRNGTAWNGNPSQNLNGAINRNPTATDRTGYKVFSTVPTLATGVNATATVLSLQSVLNAPLPVPVSAESPVLIQVGDELMSYSAITDNSLIVTRGVNETVAEPHKAGTIVRLVSGRPDGLFADQIASTDILDLRHVVNPNGFDYNALLKSNLDRLLRGELRANWKSSGTTSRGAYVHYQDALTSTTSISAGVTKVDAPDNIRLVFSDAAVTQPIEFICVPGARVDAGGSGSIGDTGWSLQLTVNATLQENADRFSAGDRIVIPVDQLRSGFQAGSTDQVRWLNDGVSGAVRLRVEGETHDLHESMYTVTPASPNFDDDITITFTSSFPGMGKLPLHIRLHAVYGPGRGLSRRPDALHSVSYLAPSSDLLTQQWGAPRGNKGAYVSWAPLWSKYRREAVNGLIPQTSEIYADLGSKTIIAQPFRRIDFPDLITMDGRAVNNASADYKSGTGVPTNGTLQGANGTAIGVTGGPNPLANIAVGDALVIESGPGRGRYVIVSAVGSTITVERAIRAAASANLTFRIYAAQGCMPLRTRTGASKYTQTDPLGLFCGTGTGNPSFESVYVSLPRHLVPGWGGLAVPIVATSNTASGDLRPFATGVNYMVRTAVGSTTPASQNNYAAYNDGGGSSKEYSVFSQVTSTQIPLEYNTRSASTGTNVWAGIRFFNDQRGLGRQGLEFPPFYGIARIFGVYQASDYIDHASPFTDARGAGGQGTAVNLLRQSMDPQDGPSMWVEVDADGDSTFILNAKAIDISKAPTPITDFAAGTYVVEAVVFGFDRGSFDINSEFRLVLTRPKTATNAKGWTFPGGVEASTSDRSFNINKVVDGLSGLLPGPAQQSDQILVNYSRTVYQGDAWGSQTSSNDIGYAPGPLFTDPAYQLVTTRLNQATLARRNPKVLEVLAATSFSTNLGTGRFSADAVADNPLDFRNVAYENWADVLNPYPPTAADARRPKVLPGNFSGYDLTNVGAEYLGCTERLPLGALFRDKDFRGQSFTFVPSPLVYSDEVGVGPAVGLYAGVTEQQEIPLGPATSGVGSPGDILVHVDGEQADYSLLTSYRVTRGGSVFTASGRRPGGALSVQTIASTPQTNHVNVLHGRAMLVRNAVTTVGASEVSAGDELMLLIVTTAQRAQPGVPANITIGTSGAGEGYSAADLYRIEGHPLVRNNTHVQVDPLSILLGRG